MPCLGFYSIDMLAHEQNNRNSRLFAMVKYQKQPKCPRAGHHSISYDAMKIVYNEIVYSYDKEVLYVLLQNHLHNLILTEKSKVQSSMYRMLPFNGKKSLYVFVYLYINYFWKATQESGNYSDL